LKTYVQETIEGGNVMCKTYGRNDFADFDTAMQASNGRAHIGVAKEGAYTAIPMDEKFLKFKSTESQCCIESKFFYGNTVAGTASKPLPGMLVTIVNGTAALEMRNENMPQIFMKNLSPQTSFLVRVRVGYESLPFPENVASPFMGPSPKYDALAMEVYSALLQEVIKDGYTADWNAFEWLGNAIKRAAPKLLRTAAGVASNFMPGMAGKALEAGAGILADSLDDEQPPAEEYEEPVARPQYQYPKRRRNSTSSRFKAMK